MCIYPGINFRLSYLGYLVQGENDEGSKGNFGIWDQVKTLNWVKSNIANFGGNPNRVSKTIRLNLSE